MSAKSDIANYSVATRFGKGKRIRHDRRWTRPQTRDEVTRHIEATYRHTKWDATEQAANSRMLGLEVKTDLGDYTDAELKIILDDLEKFSMILYED